MYALPALATAAGEGRCHSVQLVTQHLVCRPLHLSYELIIESMILPQDTCSEDFCSPLRWDVLNTRWHTHVFLALVTAADVGPFQKAYCDHKAASSLSQRRQS